MASNVIPSDAPQLTEQADIPPKDENAMQPSKTRFPLLTMVSILSQIFKWNPCGLRVTLKLPIVSNDQAPLFRQRVSPIILTPQMARNAYLNPCNVYRNLFPLKHSTALPADGIVFRPIDTPIIFSQHSPPPFISYLALAHRFWRGGLSFMYRVTSQFTNQAQVFVFKTPAVPDAYIQFDGRKGPDGSAVYAFGADNYREDPTQYMDTYQANSFINADLSVLRHVEVTCPFEQPVTRHDNIVDLEAATRTVTGEIQKIYSGTFSNWINFGLKAGIDAGSGPKEVFIECYIRAEQDFQVSDFLGYHPLLTEAEQQIFLSKYNMSENSPAIVFPNAEVENDTTAYRLTSSSRIETSV